MGELLSADEMRVWHAWKAASDRVRAHVAEQVDNATGLSDPDFGVLTRLVDLGDGQLRQNELAASIRWHRSRLSHQLTRMEQRGLVTRSGVPGGMMVSITDRGAQLVAAARPVHADAVRTYLISRVPDTRRAAFLSILESLAEG
ncbi:MarR family winged helix-turn-helix transcriptional regulator [Micromonospora sp. CA-246542]|uniref:MarR family winged helix-turn-helix transcriptional regulator n=1 Tax=Micromonospora sp. CA-246542 TaxID=3239959 RepID=UPI003D8FA8B6